MGLPSQVEYLIIGAGVHGLSTAYHLAKYLKAQGKRPDILVIEKPALPPGRRGWPAATCAATTTRSR